MNENKKILNPPAGINDWWNDDIKTTTSPNLRQRLGNLNRSFTKQEEEAVYEHFLENGFC